MSRTAARTIRGFANLITLPMNKRQREKTVARFLEDMNYGSTQEVNARGIPLKFYALRSAHIASAVTRFHEDEPETLEWIDKYIKRDETLWDIGANVGLYSLYAAAVKKANVIAFEPGAPNFGLLTEHIKLNGLGKRVAPLCVALGSETKIDMLHMKEFTAGSAMNSVGSSASQFGDFTASFTQAIPVFKADEFCEIFGLPAPDHIKLDVDGNEAEILAGMPETLKKVKTLVIEVEGQNAEEDEAIVQPVLDAGFVENKAHRTKGHQRNRLYINKEAAKANANAKSRKKKKTGTK